MIARALLLGLAALALAVGTDGVRLLPGDLPQPAASVPAEVVELHERAEAHVAGASAVARAGGRAPLPLAESAVPVSQESGVPPVPPPEA